MPNPALGYTFAPTFENTELSRGPTAAARPQEALQVLSYRLPRVLGRSALSPLLGDQPRGGPNMSVLESVFKTILGPEAAAAFLQAGNLGGMASGVSGGTPPPVIHPGGDDQIPPGFPRPTPSPESGGGSRSEEMGQWGPAVPSTSPFSRRNPFAY